jgi:hypothetical protein
VSKRCEQKSAAWRSARARRASRAARENRHRRLLADALKFKGKRQAFAAGYRQGYTAAMRWWKHRTAKAAA